MHPGDAAAGALEAAPHDTAPQVVEGNDIRVVGDRRRLRDGFASTLATPGRREMADSTTAFSLARNCQPTCSTTVSASPGGAGIGGGLGHGERQHHRHDQQRRPLVEG